MTRILAARICGTICALALLSAPAGIAQSMTAPAPRAAYYFDPARLDLKDMIPNPPDARETREELAVLHRIESGRSSAQVAAARADDLNESLFLYQTVLGPKFNPANLPATARLGAHIAQQQSAVAGRLKAIFARPRPYQADRTLHPVCPATAVSNSYPSGHSLVGYLEGLALAEIVPEKRDAILARADDFAHNRLVCGVHYPSDVEASRRISYAEFGYLQTVPKFQQELAEAKTETRAGLGLPAP